MNEQREVFVSEESTAVQREAISKLVRLHPIAIKLRAAMDFCAEHARLEDMLSNGLLIEATLAYSRRAQCSLADAREYIARVLAERADKGVASVTTPDTSVH